MHIILWYITPLVVYLGAQVIVARLGGDYRKSRWLLAVGCVLFGLSLFLPSPLLYGLATDASQHFVGGGLFCGFVWLYFKTALDFKLSWWQDVITLFGLTSSLGTLNELVELFLYQYGQNVKTVSDTSYDLLVNTLGVAAFYLGYIVLRRIKRASK